MKLNLFIISGLFTGTLLFTSCNKKGDCEELYKENCVVTQDYAPVCGCNGKTYANKSYAECADVNYTEGKCAN